MSAQSVGLAAVAIGSILVAKGLAARSRGSRAPSYPLQALGSVLDHLHALERLTRTAHWSAQGPQSYQDHLLFERLYAPLSKEIDTVAERIIGFSEGDASLVDARALDQRARALLPISGTTASQVCGLERSLQTTIAHALTYDLGNGTENLLQGIADTHETHLYLLERRFGILARKGSRAARKGPSLVGDPGVTSDEELFSILLDKTTGKREALAVARDLLRDTNGDVLRATQEPLPYDVEGLSAQGRSRLVAAGEIARRGMHRAAIRKLLPIQSPRDTVAYIESLALGPVESLIGVYVSRRMVPIGFRVLTKGSEGFTIVDPITIFRHALALGAHAFILVHNHPSGDPTPSQQDYDVTKRVVSSGRVVGITLLDHIVVARGQYVSLKERGDLE